MTQTGTVQNAAHGARCCAQLAVPLAGLKGTFSATWQHPITPCWTSVAVLLLLITVPHIWMSKPNVGPAPRRSPGSPGLYHTVF